MKNKLSFIVISIAFVAFMAILIFVMYHITIGKNIAEFGNFGDFFGGMLSPTFAFISAIVLVITLWISKKEFSRQAQVTNSQMAENTFFKLFELLQNDLEKVSNIKITDKELAKIGFSLPEKYKSDFSSKIVRYDDDTFYDFFNLFVNLKPIEKIEEKKKILFSFSQSENVIYFFKILYQLLKHVEKYEKYLVGEKYIDIISSTLPKKIYPILSLYIYNNEKNEYFIDYNRLVSKYKIQEVQNDC
ncbi:hypothetical protein AGMMS49938_18870 [Fibrobacterales bacterium]|nr:hypothetical protein AGMMS49938_18870 [Fibrobacterales bacterium]